MSVSLMTTPIASSLYFSIYEQLKTYLNNNLDEKNQFVENNMIASISTGIIVNTITNPLYLLKTKI